MIWKENNDTSNTGVRGSFVPIGSGVDPREGLSGWSAAGARRFANDKSDGDRRARETS